MNILYWICFCFAILQAGAYLYRMLKNGLSDCETIGQKIGGFIGCILGIACQIGLIYFYLH